jgi:hypothetical protein
MRTLTRAAFAALAALTTHPPTAGAQQKVDVRRAVAPDISIRIMGSFAVLRVVGWAKDSVVVTGSLPKAARFEANFGGSGSEPARGAKMYVESPNEDVALAAGELELRVPARARVWAKSGSAKSEVDGVTGGLDLNTVGGSVQVGGAPRELNVESMDGAIAVDGSPGWVRLKTAAGDITMKGGSPDAAFNTVSGTIRVSGGPLDRARFESVTGAITFDGEVAKGASLSFDSHSGAVDVQLGASASLEVDAVTVAGAIENRLTARRPVPGREGRGQEFGTSLGRGEGRLVVRTFKGTIRLGRR